MRIYILLAFMLPLFCNAQGHQKLNLDLQNQLKTMEANQSIDLYLRGDVASILGHVRNAGGAVKGVVGRIVSCSLKASQIYTLNHMEGLEYIDFTSSKPHLLNDVMLSNNNVHPIHQGVTPLAQAYFGENVIIGFVDTGIELAHGDFQNEDGSTRVLALWDQTQDEDIDFRIPEPYGYGQEWNAEDINAGITEHDDQANQYGHGSTVSGVAASNGLATGQFSGVAPKANIIAVSSDFNRLNWKSSVADAVDFVFAKADALGMPAVVNLSLGDYGGSHDGLDGAAIFIDELLDAAPGRSVVGAAGNSGNFGNYHLAYDVPLLDTAFTWFAYNPNALEGTGGVFYELWADTIDFQNTQLAIGADLTIPDFEYRGHSDWRNISAQVDQVIKDTIFFDNQILGIVETWVGLRGGQYQIQVLVSEPFSDQYLWRLSTTGGGTFDCWSYAGFGTSEIIENVPDLGSYPDIAHYQFPDNEKTIVDSWVCSDKVITVGNYINRASFENYNGELTEYDVVPGEISINCSRGPTRDMRQKPTISASGDNTLSAGRIATMNSFITNSPHKVAADGMHYINGGTSMASPVVSGVAALFFEKNQGANYADVITAIVDNAVADQQTGILPGNQYGYGKLNGFGTLSAPFGPNGLRESSMSQVQIYPNPSSGQLNIDVDDAVVDQIRIYDLTGRILINRTVFCKGSEGCMMDVSELTAGIYLLKANIGKNSWSTTKLIIEK